MVLMCIYIYVYCVNLPDGKGRKVTRNEKPCQRSRLQDMNSSVLQETAKNACPNVNSITCCFLNDGLIYINQLIPPNGLVYMGNILDFLYF
jgi:hypothetical protein